MDGTFCPGRKRLSMIAATPIARVRVKPYHAPQSSSGLKASALSPGARARRAAQKPSIQWSTLRPSPMRDVMDR
jgi:hypothetical protein